MSAYTITVSLTETDVASTVSSSVIGYTVTVLNGVPGGSGGSGTVTSVSVVTANGVSASVATATTTPALTFTLGAITPTSVAASGNVTGANLSGTNTGDQTITLTGDVTGSGTGSFAATLAASGVTAASYGSSTAIPVLTIDAKGRITGATTANVSGGATSIWIGAGEFIPRTTNGCGLDSQETSTNRVNTDGLLFDAAAIEYAQAARVIPNNWNAGTLTARFIWGAASGSGAVVWGIEGRAYANDDALDQAQGAPQTVTQTLTAAGDVCITNATSAFTLAGTPASGQLVIFEIYRDATSGSDTLGVDARLLGILLTYTAG